MNVFVAALMITVALGSCSKKETIEEEIAGTEAAVQGEFLTVMVGGVEKNGSLLSCGTNSNGDKYHLQGFIGETSNGQAKKIDIFFPKPLNIGTTYYLYDSSFPSYAVYDGNLQTTYGRITIRELDTTSAMVIKGDFRADFETNTGTEINLTDGTFSIDL